MVKVFDDNNNYARSTCHRSFKFEANWLADEECMVVINEAWVSYDDAGGVGVTAQEKLDIC